MIDNFKIIGDSLLDFDGGGFYEVKILRRNKDFRKSTGGCSCDNRNMLICSRIFYDKESFEKESDAIRLICESLDARAYILAQKRDCGRVLWNLHDKVSELIREGFSEVRFNDLVTSVVDGTHETGSDGKHLKRWVIDLDEDEYSKSGIGLEMTMSGKEPCSLGFFATYLHRMLSNALIVSGHRSGEAERFMPDVNGNYKPSDILLLKTPNGYHIVTPPFSRERAMMDEYFGVSIPNEWIKTDAMTLLYAPIGIFKNETNS